METLDDNVRDLLTGTNIAHLATILPDGGPHAVPVMVDMVDGCPAFFTSPDSRKGRNLRADDRVAISVADRDNLVRSVLIRGRVVRQVDGDKGWEIVDRIFAKYTGNSYPRGEERIAYLVEPTHVVVPTFG